MQVSWYKSFLVSLRNYYRLKKIFLFIIKIIIILKLTSIFLDIYFGYFPNIFNNITLNFYFFNFYKITYENFFYLLKNFWLLFFLFYFCFWFFYRVGNIDIYEISKRKKLNEQLKKKQSYKKKKDFKNIQQKFLLLNKKIKNYKKFLNKK